MSLGLQTRRGGRIQITALQFEELENKVADLERKVESLIAKRGRPPKEEVNDAEKE